MTSLPIETDNSEKDYSEMSIVPPISKSSVLSESTSIPKDSPICRGHDFELGQSLTTKINSFNSLDSIMSSFLTTGFQATNIALAIDQINQMRSWRLSHIPSSLLDDPEVCDPNIRKNIRARIFFSYTSNQISSGQREVIKFMVKNKMVDVIVTTAGAVEEDLIKTFEPTYVGNFNLDGKSLREKGINRIGNLLVPNKNYCRFEEWLSPLIEQMHYEQETHDRAWAKLLCLNEDGEIPERFIWTPSRIIHRLGMSIKDESSVLYWAARNKIPVFCPALTDGSIGDMLFFHSYKRRGFVLDINDDIRRINDLAVKSHCTGQIIIGGGLVKHHTCNANLMRNGANYSVYINTSHEFDGSDSGASPDEAVSWGKIRVDAKPVKIFADATIVWPLIVSQTFAKNVEEWKTQVERCVCWL